MNLSSLNLKQIWDSKEISPDLLIFKNQIRQVRFEIENELQGNVVVVTSLCPLEGKSFLVMNLAAALMIISKKVLIIDGNFSNPSISNTYSSTLYFEDFLTDGIIVQAPSEAGITILKNRGGDASLMELTTEEVMDKRINLLKREFDIVLIDATSFHGISQIKEWISLSDDVVGVFNFGGEINKKHKKHIKYLHDVEKFRGWVLNKSTEN